MRLVGTPSELRVLSIPPGPLSLLSVLRTTKKHDKIHGRYKDTPVRQVRGPTMSPTYEVRRLSSFTREKRPKEGTNI